MAEDEGKGSKTICSLSPTLEVDSAKGSFTLVRFTQYVRPFQFIIKYVPFTKTVKRTT